MAAASSEVALSRLREQVERLVHDFYRFGICDGVPDHMAFDAIGLEPEDIADARRRLIAMLRNDPRIERIHELGRSELEALVSQIVRLCVEGRLQNFLSEAELPHPLYNFLASFDENYAGPWDRVPREREAVTPIRWRLLGLPVRFPVGVPASGLTANTRWVDYFARRGFNILTYKTVRSLEFKPHKYPHWVFIEDIEPWNDLTQVGPVHGHVETWPKSLHEFSTANSFGVPSPKPKVWQRDVEESLSRLVEGQLLIVSVMGSAEEHEGAAMVQDFVDVARMAESTGARAIELNLSCPNTVRADASSGMSPPLCADPNATREIVEAVKGSLSADTRLVAKLGYVEEATLQALVGLIGGVVDGISGINTMQVAVTDPTSEAPIFVGTAKDPERVRPAAGVSGSAIRPLGVKFVSNLARLRAEFGHSFSIIGMGGVMGPEDVQEYRNAGAEAVQTATGASLNPHLPLAMIEAGMIEGVSSIGEVDVLPVVPDAANESHPRADNAPGNPKESALERIGRAVASGGLSLVLESPRGLRNVNKRGEAKDGDRVREVERP